MTLNSGTRLGTYEIVGPLGAGGMGEVYRAKDLRLGREVAVKVLPAEVASRPERLARFEREARTVAGLNHPNIVTLHSVEDEEGIPFITMELVEGETLSDLVTPGGLPLFRILELAIPLADALVAAHERGVIHRDLKPGNVMVTREGRVKVLDFGLARFAENDAPGQPQSLAATAESPLSVEGQVLGTVPYMAPEQLRGEAAGARTDLFALGIILYELATGRRPFAGGTAVDTTSAILRDMPEPLTRARPDLPGELELIVGRCLEKDPDLRYPTATELLADLKRLKEGASVSAAVPRAPVRASAASREPVRRVPAIRWVWAVIPILVVGAIVGMVLRRGPWKTGAAGARAIAVLPFENQSPDEADAFFAAGVHEDVLTRLARLRDLTVISRTSVLRFKDGRDVKEIGRRLGARYIVEGTVRRWKDQVRVTAQLVDAASDRSLWSESYDRELSDALALQSEIATKIAQALHARITPEERSRLASAATTEAGAYDEYLKARAILNSSGLTYERLTEAVERLRRAVALDPKFAEGWARLCEALSDRVERLREFDGRDADVARATKDVEEALARAKDLDPQGPATLRVEGYLENAVHRDPVRALQVLDRALEAYPNDASTLFFQATLFIQMGQVGRAVTNLERAYALDSANAIVVYALTFAYEVSRRYADMVPFLERLLELEPEKTHYAVQAKYYDFLAKGSLEAFRAFETAVRTVRRTEQCDTRSVQNNEMVVAMVNNEFDLYAKNWLGKWDRHYAGHGNWACPAITNDEANHAHLLLQHGSSAEAAKILERAKESTTRPYTEMSLCIFDRAAYQPKIDYLLGDSLAARREFEESVPKILANRAIPRGAVERSVLLQTADLVAPDRVYAVYRQVVAEPVSLVGMETVCANPWAYPNLLRDPNFVREVRKDGRFVKFMEHYRLISTAS
jgi:TolB-like protein/Tfp pilus assembly protein PilF